MYVRLYVCPDIHSTSRQNNDDDAVTFSDMPTLVLHEVSAKLDFLSILNLRKVCVNLRDIVDRSGIDVGLREITLHNFILGSCMEISGHGTSLKIFYAKEKKGCTIRWKREGMAGAEKSKYIKKGHFLDIMFNDLAVILRIQKSPLSKFHVDFNVLNTHTDEFAQKLQDTMKNQKFLLKTRTFQTTVPKSEHLMCSLPYLDSKFLKTIKIEGSADTSEHLKMDGIVEFEQWKRAEEISIFEFFVGKKDFEHFRSISYAFVTLETVDFEDFICWKEKFLQYPELEQVFINSNHVNEEQMVELFGHLDANQPVETFKASCCFRIRGSDNVIGVFWMTDSLFQMKRNKFSSTSFDRVHSS